MCAARLVAQRLEVMDCYSIPNRVEKRWVVDFIGVLERFCDE